MHKKLIFISIIIVLMLCGCKTQTIDSDLHQISGQAHYVDGYEPIGEAGYLRVVIEIPTGTTEKWEVDKSDGKLHWEVKNGKRRIVQYIGYPGNYGMIPQTLLSYENGGDGDPLDVLVLGPPIKRGEIVQARLIGGLSLLDGGEQDDKLIAVMENTVFQSVSSIENLDQKFPGVLSIIETWFVSYKGQGKIESSGFLSPIEANTILEKAIHSYDLYLLEKH